MTSQTGTNGGEVTEAVSYLSTQPQGTVPSESSRARTRLYMCDAQVRDAFVWDALDTPGDKDAGTRSLLGR